MQVSTRTFLTAGLSFVAGAIVGMPMSPPAPQQQPSHPLVRANCQPTSPGSAALASRSAFTGAKPQLSVP
jgi:hypothetical protein